MGPAHPLRRTLHMARVFAPAKVGAQDTKTLRLRCRAYVGPTTRGGQMSEHVWNWREPLHVGIIVVIICMICAIRRCISHSYVETPIPLLTMAARADAGGHKAWCIGLKVIWRWTLRTSNWQSRGTGRTGPARRHAWTSPKKIWLDRKYVYIEHMDRKGEQP